MTTRWITADVFDGLAILDDGTVDLVITSPPFLALRSYLPSDHRDKGKEIGSESTPAEFLDVMLRVTAELRRVLAPHGSICVELGDTYAGSGGAGGDYEETGLRGGQNHFDGSASGARRASRKGYGGAADRLDAPVPTKGPGWPLAKSKTLIPELYRIALAYGINPLTGTESPAGRWRVRNVVTWCRPNPPVGALGDKWRPATSDVVVACVSDKRYWDDIATRGPYKPSMQRLIEKGDGRYKNKPDQNAGIGSDWTNKEGFVGKDRGGAPLLDYWEIPPGGYKGSHYAVFPEELVVPCVKAMAPSKVCRVCGEPSRRVFEHNGNTTDYGSRDIGQRLSGGPPTGVDGKKIVPTGEWTDCGHDDYRPGIVLDPFAGSGTTLSVATGHGHEAIGIDLDERNRDLAYDRIGPLLWEEATT